MGSWAIQILNQMLPAPIDHDPLEVVAYLAVGFCGAGGVLIATGCFPRLGCIFVIAFLVPVTYFQHALAWRVAIDQGDEKVQTREMLQIMKNLSMIGAAFALFGYECGMVSIEK